MAERNPRIPHSIESLLFVNRNGKYCGYKLELISDNIGADLREFLICAECKGISRKPRNWEGYRVCKICLPGHSMRKINKRAEYKVALLNARCPLSEEGCGWEGRLGEIEEHMEECLKLRVERQLECGIPTERGIYEQDNREVCPLKMKRCDYCNQEVQANEENRHKGKCQYHPDTEVPCPYKEIGCDEIVLRKERAIHLTENMTSHNKLMQIQTEQRNQLRNKNQQLERVNEQQKIWNEEQLRVNEQQKYRNEGLERVNEQHENRNQQLERVNEQQKNRNEELEIISEQQENKNHQLERVNQQQKIRNEEVERVNEQQKYRNEELERIDEQQKYRNEGLEKINVQQKNKNVQQEKGNQLLERVNEQQKNKIEEQQRVNEQQKNKIEELVKVNLQQKIRNEELERVNQQRITTNEILETNHQQRQSDTERELEDTKDRNKEKRRWRVWALLALVVVGVRILITAMIGIAVAVTKGNNLKANSNQPKTNANQPETNSNQPETNSNQLETNSNQPETNLTLNESLLSNTSYIYEYIGARRKFLPGIKKIYNLTKTGTFYGPTFYLGQCKLRLKTYALVTTHLNYERYTKYFVERLEGEYDGLIDNCIITCAYTTFQYMNPAQTQDIDSTYPSIDLKVGESKIISYKYWKQSGGEVMVKFYFDTTGVLILSQD